MTIREMKELVNSVKEELLDCPCLIQVKSTLHGMFAFEEVCPGLTEIITLGPPPEFVGADVESYPNGQHALLISSHKFHEDEQHEKGKEVLN
jgi:hypothetical protein